MDDTRTDASMFDAPSARAGSRSAAARFARQVYRVVFSADRRRAIRLYQWTTAGAVYLACALLMAGGTAQGWMRGTHLAAWSVFVGTGVMSAYVALRSGWSERLADPSLTRLQIVLAIIAVDWGYAICGPMRTVALFPLLVVFAFAAFQLRGRQIGMLTAFALISLGMVMAWQSRFPPTWNQLRVDASLPVDRVNYLMVLILLPALAAVSERLSSIRSALHKRRAELTQALAEVQRLATTDELTGLPNRRWMTERLLQEERRARDEGSGFCVAVIDLDHFKHVNDRFGHAQGDAVLCDFASRARDVLPARDTLARWGGEEFLLLMPAVLCDEAVARLEYLLRSVKRIRSADGPLSFSAGVAAFNPTSPALDTVLAADQRMYAAKQAGRDRVHGP